MAIRVGADTVDALYVGTNAITVAYLGSDILSVGEGGRGGYAATGAHLDGSFNLRTESLTAPGDDTGYCSWVYHFKASSSGLANGSVLWVVDPDNTYTSNAYLSVINAGNVLLHHQFCNVDDSGCWNANSDGSHLISRDDAWHTVYVSVQVKHTTGQKIYNYYLDENAFSSTFAQSGANGGNANTLQFNGLAFAVFDDGFDDGYTGDVAEFWIAPGQYLDFSVEANRRKFTDADGKPISKGADGSLPTGTAPAIFLSKNNGDAIPFTQNRGAGGALTVTGSVSDATTSPSD